MRRSQFTDEEIHYLLEEARRGVPIAEICRASRISERTFYRWRRRLGGLSQPALEHLKELELENGRLREQVRELSTPRGAQAPASSSRPLSGPAASSTGGPTSGMTPLSNRSTAMLAGRFAGARLPT